MGFPGVLAGKNPPANAEDVRDMGSKGTVSNSSIFAWRTPMDKGAWCAIVHGVAKSWT